MNWPEDKDWGEAVQNPKLVFRDQELKHSTVETNQLGLPRPRSGNFAVVFKATTRDGKDWAIRCFTREVGGQEQRYTAIHREIERQRLPFTVGFGYQSNGILVQGRWYPILKMEWVQGESLAAYVETVLSATFSH